MALLGDRDPRHLAQKRRQTAHGDSVAIVQRMGHGLDPRPHSMCGGAMLVHGHVRVLSPRLPPAFPAPADMHSEQTDFRLRRCLHIRHRYFFRFFPLQSSTAEGTASLLDGNINRGSAAGVGGRSLAARERSLPWLASRPLRKSSSARPWKTALRCAYPICRCNSRIKRSRSSRLRESRSGIQHYGPDLFARPQLLNPVTC
jgi:hypothetical protein